MFEMVIWN